MTAINPLDVPAVPHTVARATQAITVVTAICSATPHTKGGYTQVWSATTKDTHMLRVFIDGTFTSAADTSTLLDIAIGSVGNEVVIVNNLLCGYWRPSIVTQGSSTPVPGYYDIPVYIPAGTRIAVRAQSTVVSANIGVAIDLFGASTLHGLPFTCAAVDTIGALTASSHGTVVAVGTSGAAGAWVQLTASTTAGYRALLLGVDGAGSTAVTSVNATVDLATGASGSEQLLVPADWVQLSMNNQESIDLRSPSNHLIPVGVPAGSRIAVRATQNLGTAQNVGIAVYGIR